ncbi:2OG-Fe(II) oxygenase [Pedobacter alpinus]|uniref:2OG-Fe(II) oxygenase n=1 Tax=Pedobacter alpinus TaxID=1590643 RepID=A0ABW5TPD1_9SPHI
MESFLNISNQNLIEIATNAQSNYLNANPFPSATFDNFFNPQLLEEILEEFPDLSKKDSISFNDQKQIKLAGKGESNFGPKTKSFMHFLNSEPFINFLQILTGIKEPLIGDPYFFGGGQHEIKKGGLLKVHADFNKHPQLHLDRRINVLVYLNKDWKEEYGGYFELWDKNMEKCEKKILPVFNTMAIFSTTDFSYHGHPDALNCPEGMSRKSLALYYYSNGRPASEINQNLEKHNTLFKERKNNATDNIAFKLTTKEKVKILVKDLLPPIIGKIIKGQKG